MVEQKIEFRKIRDFGENLNDTFVFIGQNLRPLLKALFAICGAFMIMQAIFSGLYQYKTFGILQQIMNPKGISTSQQFNEFFTPHYFLTVCFPLLVISAMQTVCASYIKFYIRHDGRQPAIEDVWSMFLTYFLKVFAYNFVATLLIVLAFPFCFFPAVYLYVLFVPLSLITIIEDKSLFDGFRRCAVLIRENFWSSFFIYFVSYLIYSFSGTIIGAAVTFIIGLGAYLTTKDLRTTVSIATSFLNIFTYAFYVVYITSVALQYFNLAEQQDGTGILDRINRIGGGTSMPDRIDEQY